MTGTVVLVTGANSGLGLATVQALAASPRGYRVLVGARTLDKAAEAVKQLSPSSGSEVRPIEVNISSDESIARAYDTVKEKYGRIDVLINNAGANFDILHRQGQMGLREAWAQSWDTNVTGGHVLTHTFAPLLLASQDPRLVFVSSTTASLQVASGPPPSWNAAMPAGWPKPAVGIAFSAYRSSKTGLNMMMLEWARMFKQDGVRVFGVDPGRLVTNLGRRKPDPEMAQKMGLRDPSEGADLLLQIVEGKKDAEAGKVIDENGGVMPW